MNKKIIIFGFLFGALLLLSSGGVYAQSTLDSLMDKVGQISMEGKAAVDILNEVSQEGELDTTVPKRTITLGEGQIETIFVFDFAAEPEASFEGFKDYFVKREAYQVLNEEESGEVKGSELQKGTTKMVLVGKGDIVVESRIEGFVVMPEAPEVEEEPGEVAGGAMAVLPFWAWIVIAAVVIVAFIFGIYSIVRKNKD